MRHGGRILAGAISASIATGIAALCLILGLSLISKMLGGVSAVGLSFIGGLFSAVMAFFGSLLFGTSLYFRAIRNRREWALGQWLATGAIAGSLPGILLLGPPGIIFGALLGLAGAVAFRAAVMPEPRSSLARRR